MIEYDRLLRPDLEPRGALIRDLILQLGCGVIAMVDALDQAWTAGYEAKEAEEAEIVCREEPIEAVQSNARYVLMQHPLPSMRARADRTWTWQADMAGWSVEGDDCTIRPSRKGDAVIVMEAAGEWAGEVIGEKARFQFHQGTFR